jgi:RnfABCDGE-type electron transport complex G subunit
MKSFTLLALVCGLLLGTLHSLTSKTIAENSKAYALMQLRSVIDHSPDEIEEMGNNHYSLRLDGSVTGFIFAQTTEEGYNGIIKSWIAIDSNKTIRGVRVFVHQETPGIGDKIDLPVSDWIKVFDGKSLTSNNWSLSRTGGDFDHFSGATITSRAMVHSVRSGLEHAETNMDEWLESTEIQNE